MSISKAMANSISGTNSVGKFSVLPGHADFFSMLIAGPVEIVNDETVTSFTLESGLITVKQNEVYLFVNV